MQTADINRFKKLNERMHNIVTFIKIKHALEGKFPKLTPYKIHKLNSLENWLNKDFKRLKGLECTKI